MKIAVERTSAQETPHPGATPSPLPPSVLSNKPTFPRKQPRPKLKISGAMVRVKRETPRRGALPETPLLRWKFDETNDKNNSLEEDQSSTEVGRKIGRRHKSVVSARKLGAGLRRLHLAEPHTNGGQVLWLQRGVGHPGATIHVHHVDQMHGSPANNLVHNPLYVSAAKTGLQHKLGPSFRFSNSATEGPTKWDRMGGTTSDELVQMFGQIKLLNEGSSDTPAVSALEGQLEQARARVNELEAERISSKKKLEQFFQNISEERADWRSREHGKIGEVIDDVKAELNRGKKNRRRLERVNSKLVNELADAKISVKHSLQEYEKERKARELIEEVCDELAKEIGEDKGEAETLKRESRELWEEVDEERRMLQMAQVWREERVQMKLVDAKLMLEEKYSQMKRIISDLDAFLNSRSTTSDLDEIKKAEFFQGVAASIDTQDIRELKYEPPNPDDMLPVFEDINFGQSNEREMEPYIGYSPPRNNTKTQNVTPELKLLNKDRADRHSSVYVDHSGELDEEASEWETASHPEDQGLSYSPDGSDPSVNKSFCASHVSREWGSNEGVETPTMENSEVCSRQPRPLKKASSAFRLWKSYPSNGDNYKIISVEGGDRRLSNGRHSNGAFLSPDCGSGKDDHSPQDLTAQWSLLDSRNLHLTRGMKGHIEWPCSVQGSSSKARLLEARMDSQKINLR